MKYNIVITEETASFDFLCGIMGNTTISKEVFNMNAKEKELLEVIRGSENPEEVMRATVLAIIECLEKRGALKSE